MKQVEIDEDGSITKEDWNLCILGSGRRVVETKRMCRRAEGQKRHNVSDLAEAARRAVMDGLAIVIFDVKALALACICLMLMFPVVLSFILRVIRGLLWVFGSIYGGLGNLLGSINCMKRDRQPFEVSPIFNSLDFIRGVFRVFQSTA
jgi:hypothetical protein